MSCTIFPSAIRDPFEFYKRLRQTAPHTCILESLGEYDPEFSRYSFIGALPSETLTKTGDDIFVTDLRNNSHTKVGSWLEDLNRWTCLEKSPSSTSPIQTGVIGYIGYDAKYEFERLTRSIPLDIEMPEIYLVRYDAILIHDRQTGKSNWAVTKGCEARCRELEQLAQHPAPIVSKPFMLNDPLTPDFTLDQYLDSIRRTTEYIRAGDIYQANITGRFSARYDGDVIHLYERLRQTTPNPFFALLDFPHPIISTSPERFFAVRDNRITASPIKGTVSCNVDGVDQRSWLERSAKDRAENIMITDLMRNDLGRVCAKDSVKVDTLCGVKRFNNLYHLESIVSGALKPNMSLSNLLRALFPCGSVTGAPKIRAMDIIEELEITRRGPYTGALGFFGSSGWIDTSVAIRIAYFHSGRLFLHAGGGIVADSESDGEYHEMLAKLSGIKASLGSFQTSR